MISERREIAEDSIVLTKRSDNLFGRTFACSCGRTHRIDPKEVIRDDRAVERLGEVCARYTDGRRTAVLMDARTREVAGRRAAAVLAEDGWEITEVVVADLPNGGSPVCDDSTRQRLSDQLQGADVILSVGSGVINDLGKWAAFEGGAAFVTFATAASMNGYTSANVAPTIRGVKSLIRARPPLAVLTSPAIVRDAPFELTSAGLGDVLAKSVSSTDWYLNHLLFEDYYCPEAVGLIGDIEPLYLDRPADLPARKGEALDALFEALLLTGAAMTMAETSAPASGGEHLISHCLDMMSYLDGRAHDLHGRQVGVGTILAAELYRRVLQLESPRWRDPPPGIDEGFWGPLSGEVQRQYAEKADRLRSAREGLEGRGGWDRLRERIAAMLTPPERIRDCLARAAAAHTAEDIVPDASPPDARERLLQAFMHAHEIRSRFTVFDLAYLTGVMPAAARDIVAAWA